MRCACACVCVLLRLRALVLTSLAIERRMRSRACVCVCYASVVFFQPARAYDHKFATGNNCGAHSAQYNDADEDQQQPRREVELSVMYEKHGSKRGKREKKTKGAH